MTALVYRAPRDGDRFAAWLDVAKGKSGVYVFRGAWSGAVHYVGESHSGNLYRTITRHFWTWADRTGRPHYSIQSLLQPVELAVRIMPAHRAKAEQDRLILRLQPSHNQQTPRDVVPF